MPKAKINQLSKLNIDPEGISVSGISSGADFAIQFQVAFSSVVKGVGVFAGQPYHCAVTRFNGDRLVSPCFGTTEDGSTPGCTKEIPSPDVPWCENCPSGGLVVTYDHCKRHPERVNVSSLLEYARVQAGKGSIDPLSNLAGTKVYLYRGTKDSFYAKGTVQHSQTFFEALGARVLFNSTTPSEHSWPTIDYGTPCGQGVIEACGYDGPGAALQHIYGGVLHPPERSLSRHLTLFDQTPFMTQDNNGTQQYNATMPHVTGFAPEGYLYVPSRCRDGSPCKLHFSLHGCGVDGYYEEAVHHLGFQNWGEANDIVIVFPRIQPHGGTEETQAGCWDGYAQSGRDYALKSGAQMRAVRQMVAAVGGPPAEPPV